MIGHRMSALPLTRYCAKAGLLSAQYGSAIEALISQVYHAKCAQAEGWQELANRLPLDRREDVLSWPPPPVIEVSDLDGVLQSLDYGEALVELTVALDGLGFYCDPSVALTEGHLDMAWAPKDSRTVFVGDIKRTRWTVPEFEESLQLHAYGLAAATKYERESYRIGIWTPSEGLWWWDDRVIEVDSLLGAQYQRAVTAAARNRDGDAVTGPHCTNCYGRFHCPDLLLPAALGCTKLRAICDGLGREPSDDEILEALHEMCALDALLAVAKPALQGLSDRKPIKDRATGKLYYGRPRQGRESVNIQALRQGLGEQAEQYISRGQPSLTHRWYSS